MLSLFLLALCGGFAYLLYLGFRARLMPHQPPWQAAALVGIIVALFIGAVLAEFELSKRPNRGVDDYDCDGDSCAPERAEQL